MAITKEAPFKDLPAAYRPVLDLSESLNARYSARWVPSWRDNDMVNYGPVRDGYIGGLFCPIFPLDMATVQKRRERSVDVFISTAGACNHPLLRMRKSFRVIRDYLIGWLWASRRETSTTGPCGLSSPSWVLEAWQKKLGPSAKRAKMQYPGDCQDHYKVALPTFN